MALNYNDPIGGVPSDISDEQFNMFKWQKKALQEVQKKAVFGNLASTINMPKHMGKTIKRYHYVPFLSDANINDEGIDANGLSTQLEKTIKIIGPNGAGANLENIYTTVYAVGGGASEGAATTAAEAAALDILVNRLGFTGADYASAKADAISKGTAVDDTTPAVPDTGNLYGSSKDVGTISGKMPRLDENGGMKNRVSGRRIQLEGSMDFFGMYRTWSRESMDFDTDDQLQAHQTREMMYAAHEVVEDLTQIDLLNEAGVIRLGGDATATSELNGEATPSLVTYADLMRLAITLSDNRCDKDTTVISGTRMTDTRTIRSTYVMYIGSELIPMIEKMTDHFGNEAFISVEKYAAAGQPISGEIGKVGQFTIVVAPEMMHWEGAGAPVVTNTGYRETGGNYDVFPMLVVGNDSFNTIGFASDGKSSKFKIINKMPGEASADLNDPYGLTGFSSIQFYYGFLAVRPERIALIKTVAEI